MYTIFATIMSQTRETYDVLEAGFSYFGAYAGKFKIYFLYHVDFVSSMNMYMNNTTSIEEIYPAFNLEKAHY